MCAEVSTATTTRLRTLQLAVSTSISSIDTPSCSTLLVGHQNVRRDEMAKRTEIEPLLASPSHETHYTSDRSKDNSMMNNSIHLEIDAETAQPGSSMSMNIEVDESLNSFDDDDRSLLIVDKPTSVRTQSEQNVYLFNFLALFFVFVNMTLNLTVLAIIHERVPMKEPHLPDIAFDLFPDNRRFLDVAEYFIVIQMVGIFFLLFFHKHR